MPLKRHEDKPWEWQELQCELAAHGQTDCVGTMDLKDVNLKVRLKAVGGIESYSLEKVYICNECGHVFLGYDDATIIRPTM